MSPDLIWMCVLTSYERMADLKYCVWLTHLKISLENKAVHISRLYASKFCTWSNLHNRFCISSNALTLHFAFTVSEHWSWVCTVLVQLLITLLYWYMWISWEGGQCTSVDCEAWSSATWLVYISWSSYKEISRKVWNALPTNLPFGCWSSAVWVVKSCKEGIYFALCHWVLSLKVILFDHRTLCNSFQSGLIWNCLKLFT